MNWFKPHLFITSIKIVCFGPPVENRVFSVSFHLISIIYAVITTQLPIQSADSKYYRTFSPSSTLSFGPMLARQISSIECESADYSNDRRGMLMFRYLSKNRHT